MILETLLLTTLLLLLGSASYTDCRVSHIWNRHLGYAAVPIFLLDFAYYSPLVGDGLAYWQPFLLNSVCLALTGLLLYALHIWAAGDTKLLLLVALAIPGRLYGGHLPYVGSGILIVAFAFLAAFAYVVLCGLGQRWRASRRLQGPQGENIRTVVKKLDWPRIAASYLLMVTLVQLIMAIGHVLLPTAAAKSPLIDAAASCALILAILSLRSRMTTKQMAGGAVLSSTGLLLGSATQMLSISYAMSAAILLWTAVLMCLRMLVQDYNYRTIPTEEVREGQILAAGTVCRFARSRVRNLPTGMTEDLSSRLTAEEAASVRHWQHSRYGEDTVVIVRKIPFAIFIAVGTIAFLIFEVVGL